MTNRPKAIGTAGETALVRYAQANGFPLAERLALHGAHDIGDVRLTVGAIAEVKAGRTAQSASYHQKLAWLEETERERVHAGADIAILVIQRKGFGIGRVEAWECWWREMFPFPAPACVTVENGLHRLRYSGWGDPL